MTLADWDLAGPFALGTFAAPGGGAPFPGLVVAGRVRDLRPDGLPATSARGLLAEWDTVLPRLAELADRGPGTWLAADDVRVLPPVRPLNLLQSGANYRKHVIDIIVSEHDPADGRTAEEVRADAAAFMEHRATRTDPYLFIGLPSAMCGARDDIVLPAEGTEHDWELELAAVIGRPARRVPPEQALGHVAAYTICNDLTTRDLVYRPDLRKIGTDWLRSKNAPTFLPTGPVLVPSVFVGDPMDLRITLSVNGQVMQDESTKDMIFDVARLVSYASQITALQPGDLILTGSPAGNGAHWRRFLRDGDRIDATITGLGRQRNLCVAEPPAPGGVS
jgi:2-keto-4-pentenoate hydratase/2-oxohepta-3-ene-1,7-dioic acid hydratase in catechol pathway